MAALAFSPLRFAHLKQAGSALTWTAVLAGCYLLSECAETANLPSPQLLVALLAGAALALSGVTTRTPPRVVTRSSHAVIGALMGSYLEPHALAAVGNSALPLLLVTLATVALGVGTAFLLSSRARQLTLEDSTLGMVPGGSAAIIACASDVGADARLVAFAQYLRVGLVALTAPFLALGLDGAAPAAPTSVSIGFPMLGHLVSAPDQVSRLVVLAAVCALGAAAGRRLSLPAPVLLGSMLVAALAVATNAADGFAPAGPLRDLVFIVVGLEVGLRFTRSSVRRLGRAVLWFLGATVLVCLACTGLAWVLSEAVGMPFLDAYLATTPGGINAVLATAQSTSASVPVVTAVQSLRLFAVCLLVPPLIRWLGRRGAPHEA